MARVPGTAGRPTLAVIGHIDEIGIHVTHIEDDGHLRFGEVGGWDPIVLVGQRVSIASRGGDVTGVIGRKPIHLIKSDERDRAPKVKDLHVDIGAKDGDEAKEMVRIGDAGVIDVAPVELPNGRLVSRVAGQPGRLLRRGRGRPPGGRRRRRARRRARAGGDPGGDELRRLAHERVRPGARRGDRRRRHLRHRPARDRAGPDDQAPARLGSGDRARDGAASPASPTCSSTIAEEEEFPFTLESLGRATGTDADAVHASRIGVPTAIVSVPLRYMHSPVELVSLADVEVAAELIAAFAKRLEPGMSFAR